MITTAQGNSQLTSNYLYSKQSVSSFEYRESSLKINDKNNQLAADTVTLSYSSESIITYNQSMNVEGVLGDAYETLRSMVMDVFQQQGIDTKVDTGDSEIDISTLSQEEAQELIADDGYFGVEKTSERIFQFAVGIAGGDPARLDAIRAGVEQGFEEAKDAFGGWLPDISYDTYDAVMNKLDEWAEVGETSH